MNMTKTISSYLKILCFLSSSFVLCQGVDLDEPLDLDNIDWNTTEIQEKPISTFRGTPCDDTEYRNDWGSPNWKNYGRWLSECDSLEWAYQEAQWAPIEAKRKLEKLEAKKQRELEIASMEVELDLDAMWENTVWNEIEDVIEDVTYETEYITAVAGVRGAEAEDEALDHLYYRRSMKMLSQMDYKKAYGKLKNKRDNIYNKDPNNKELVKIDMYLKQLRNKIHG